MELRKAEEGYGAYGGLRREIPGAFPDFGLNFPQPFSFPVHKPCQEEHF